MPQIISDIYTWINSIAFVIALLDKITCGSMSRLFWLVTKCFGALGTTLGCLLFRHRTRNGDVAKTIFYAVIQIGILGLLGSIF